MTSYNYNYAPPPIPTVPLQYQYSPAPYAYPDYSAYYAVPPPIPPEPPQAPLPVVQPSTITASVASQTMRRLLAAQLRNAGFKSYERHTLERFENEVVAFMMTLLRHAKEAATLCNRATPMVYDVFTVCETHGLTAEQLRKASKKRKRKQEPPPSTRLVSPPPREPSPDILPSDEEDAPPVPVILPQTLQDLPDYLPSLPPKHTYLHTAPATLKRIKAPSLDRKLDNATKVQQALRHLVKATEEVSGKGDLELASGVVNWKSTQSADRKRWKLR